MNQTATASLIELRAHFQSLLAQYDQASAHAKAQLEHVEALLLEALLPAPEHLIHNATLIADHSDQQKAIAPAIATPTPNSSEATPVPATPAKPPRKSSKSAKPKASSSRAVTHRESASLQESAQTQEITHAPAPVAAADPTPAEAVQRDADSPVLPKPAPKREGNAPKSKVTSAKPATARKRGTDMVLKLPAQYEGMRKLDAVALVLESNPGNPMHIDTIIDKLYGILPDDVHKAEKIRMSNVMARGVKDDLWKRAIAAGCYMVPVIESKLA